MRKPTLLAPKILSIALMLFSVVALGTPRHTINTQSSIQITLTEQKNTTIRLEARQAPLGNILKEIATKTGAIIHYSVLPEAPVTATCAGANVGQIMDCLVAKQVGLIAHTTQKDKPAEFWLLGSSVGSCQAVTVAPPLLNEKKQEKNPTPDELAKLSQMLQEQSMQLIEQAHSKEPDQRASAVANLGSVGVKDDPSVDEALHNAMQDNNANVRAQAITAILRRGSEQASEYLIQALQDKDATVRLTAVSAIEDDMIFLQQALNDSDEAVRNMAKDKLDDMAGSQAKAQ
jgi:hypothetical protein